MDDILGLSTKPATDHTKRVKGLVRNSWGIDEDVVIMVSELRCHEDDCPDVETVIALMTGGNEPPKVKIMKPMSELQAADIDAVRPE
jgi:hypothetical protein